MMGLKELAVATARDDLTNHVLLPLRTSAREFVDWQSDDYERDEAAWLGAYHAELARMVAAIEATPRTVGDMRKRADLDAAVRSAIHWARIENMEKVVIADDSATVHDAWRWVKMMYVGFAERPALAASIRYLHRLMIDLEIKPALDLT